jgi:hypothetical protein
MDRLRLLDTFEVFNNYKFMNIYKFFIDENTIVYTNQRDFVYDPDRTYDEDFPDEWSLIVDKDFVPSPENEDEGNDVIDFEDEVDLTREEYTNVYFFDSD